MSSEVVTGLGRQLRLARQRAGMSQSQVASEAGLSESFIRMVEGGRSDISLSRLLKWTSVFDMAIGDLLGQEIASPIAVTRSEERSLVPLDEENGGVRFYLLTAALNHAMEPGVFVLSPGARMQQELRHQGEESLFVLRGRIRLTVESEAIELAEGDAAYYKSTAAHSLANLSEIDAAEVLITATHPSTPARLARSERTAPAPEKGDD